MEVLAGLPMVCENRPFDFESSSYVGGGQGGVSRQVDDNVFLRYMPFGLKVQAQVQVKVLAQVQVKVQVLELKLARHPDQQPPPWMALSGA